MKDVRSSHKGKDYRGTQYSPHSNECHSVGLDVMEVGDIDFFFAAHTRELDKIRNRTAMKQFHRKTWQHPVEGHNGMAYAVIGVEIIVSTKTFHDLMRQLGCDDGYMVVLSDSLIDLVDPQLSSPDCGQGRWSTD